jgi:serine/threonine protein kinase
VKLTSGSKIKNYTLDERIGIGASGEVWKANDGSKTVAIKFMNENLIQSASASKHRMRLEREVEALRRLQHPNVPTLFDYDLDFERPYLAMRFVGGETYDKLIANGQMLKVPLEKRMEIISELAMALKAAHGLGIIHRDIKPSNMTGVETPYLLDFSISLKSEDVMSTMRDVGTAFYMEPDGQPDELGDNYGFALVAYEILFGTHAIFTYEDRYPQMPEHTRYVAGERIKNHEWRMPSTLSSEELPADLRDANLTRLDDVFEKAFGERDQRYTDLRQFVDDLRAAVLTPTAVPASVTQTSYDQNAHTLLEANEPTPAANGTPPAPIPPPAPQPAAPVFKSQPIPTGDQYTILEATKGEAAPSAVGSRAPSRTMIIAAVVIIGIVVIVALLMLSKGA